MNVPFVNFSMERAMGIEPTFKAWEALVLPMNYARDKSSLLNQTDNIGLIVIVQIVYVQSKLFLYLLRI